MCFTVFDTYIFYIQINNDLFYHIKCIDCKNFYFTVFTK